MSTLAVTYTRANVGIDAPLVTVEVHITNGLPALAIVGLPETAVRESKERVRSAIINSGFEFPTRRLTINLAPADLPKEGGHFDLAIAVGILVASGQIHSTQLATLEFLGELALTGELRPVLGVLPAAVQCGKLNHRLVIPTENAIEASLAKQTTIFTATDLKTVCSGIQEEINLKRCPAARPDQRNPTQITQDFQDVVGQPHAKRALEIAAAGGHHLLMIGPPGAGKTMLIQRIAGILMPLSEDEQLELAAIRSLSQEKYAMNIVRPFRSPHHTISQVGLVGGGSIPRPGEISLAHHGVLFLDELPEFDRRVLELLRQPLESGEIWISRAKQKVRFPAKFQLIAAMNPCPCGYHHDNSGRCCCSIEKIKRYQQRLSGPLLDRIDIQISLAKTQISEMKNKKKCIDSSAEIKTRVVTAAEKQHLRQKKLNAHLNANEIESFCGLSANDQALLWQAIEKYQLSMRAHNKIVKVARTIADLAESKNISTDHLTEALSYRTTLHASLQH